MFSSSSFSFLNFVVITDVYFSQFDRYHNCHLGQSCGADNINPVVCCRVDSCIDGRISNKLVW